MAITSIPLLSFNQNSISTEELIGKGNPNLFGHSFKLREEAFNAFQNMKAEALKEGVNIQIISSYRDFKHQKRIWEGKYNRYRSQGLSEEKTIQKIIEYSTIPGTSRHHWGTDIDIIDAKVSQPKHVLREENFHRDGPYIYLNQWMSQHASSFGFYLVYTNEPKRKGFKYEPWHYSYKPLSKQYINRYKSLNIKDVLQKERLMGSPHFSEAFINTYLRENILDINPELL